MSWRIEGFGWPQSSIICGGKSLTALGAEFRPGRSRVFTIFEEKVATLHRHKLPERGQKTLILPSLGEGLKQVGWLNLLLHYFSRQNISREDWVVAVGGGALLDLVNFAASIYKRGLATVLFPTTLLAQVDAAIGGKTGINWQGAKNVVGTYYFPRYIYCATDVLTTLSRRQFFSGMAEVVKYYMLMNALPQLPPIQRLSHGVVERCCRYKNEVVAGDPHDLGRRRLLNLGHTLAHALEAVCGDMLHGEAVAWGLEFAAAVALARKYISQQQFAQWCQVLRSLPRPSLPEVSFSDIYDVMKKDKKNVTGGVSMVLPRGDEYVLARCSLKELALCWQMLR